MYLRRSPAGHVRGPSCSCSSVTEATSRAMKLRRDVTPGGYDEQEDHRRAPARCSTKILSACNWKACCSFCAELSSGTMLLPCTAALWLPTSSSPAHQETRPKMTSGLWPPPSYGDVAAPERYSVRRWLRRAHRMMDTRLLPGSTPRRSSRGELFGTVTTNVRTRHKPCLSGMTREPQTRPIVASLA